MLDNKTTAVELDLEKPNERKDDCGVNTLQNYEASIVIDASNESKNLEHASWCCKQRNIMDEVCANKEEMALLQRKKEEGG